MAQADMFLKLTNIKGESTDSKHKDEIEVLSWSLGASQTGAGHYGTGSGAGKVEFQDLHVTKHVDHATPSLLQHLTTGKHIDEGLLTCRKAGGTALEYLKFKMEQCLVSSQTFGGGQGSDQVTESITLNFRKFTQTYTPQDPKGTAKPSTDFTWDIAAAKEK
jgi:type VI secretion system secreted protein Hcp